MTTYVYDYPSGSTASFYIDGDYVYPMSGTQPAFWIMGILVSQPSNWHASIFGKRQVRFQSQRHFADRLWVKCFA